MKKAVALILVIVLAFCLAACAKSAGAQNAASEQQSAATSNAEETSAVSSEQASQEPEKSESSGNLPVIGMSHFGVGTNNYTTVYTQTLNDMMDKEYKGKVEFVLLDAQNDAEKQLSDIDDLIQMKCNVVIVWPVSTTAIIPGIKKLYDAGIPIINTNSGIDASGQDMLTAFSGPSDYNQGHQAGEAMIKALGGKGNVVELAGTAGYDATIQRSAGFADAIKDSDIKMLESQPTDWSTEKAQTVMETFLTKYGDKINGIFCCADSVSAGAMNALDAVGKNDGSIAITSATLYASGYDAISQGKQYASILQSPIEDAKLALDLAVKVANGETVDKDNRITTYIVTKDNYKDYDRPTW